MIGKKKGQVNLYFLVSIALFISLSLYLVYLLIGFYPAKGETIRINSLYSKAYTISELMIKDPGYPEDWNENTLERIGLASTPYEINSTKLSRFSNLCSQPDPLSRERLLNSSGLFDEYFIITMAYLNGTSVLTCSTSGETTLDSEYLRKRTAQISRIVSLNNQTIDVKIYVG